MILRVPPENLWPTGATPPELREVIHANGQLTPEEMNRQRAQAERGVENYRPPPRQFNPADIEAERQSLRLVESVSPPLPVPQGTPLQNLPANVQRYLVPLSHTVNAEIVIHGRATAKDFKLLQKYVRLMSRVEEPPIQSAEAAQAAVLNIKRPRKSYAASA